MFVPFLARVVRTMRYGSRAPTDRFPWWGWIAVGWTLLAWSLAWSRLEWMDSIQGLTFTPLWLGFIVTVNALTFRRIGHCMMLHRPRYFLSLFPLSALFWWSFEYLNRFVQNWYYLGGQELTAWEYLWQATLSFSTVLPAVLGTAEWLSTYRRQVVGWIQGRSAGSQIEWPGDGGCSAGLQHASWVSVCGRTSCSFWCGLLHCFSLPHCNGFDMNRPFSTIRVMEIGAFCGPSHSRRYSVASFGSYGISTAWPTGNMPCRSCTGLNCSICLLLGYAGYLPFGLECLAVADLCLARKFSGGAAYYREAGGGTDLAQRKPTVGNVDVKAHRCGWPSSA